MNPFFTFLGVCFLTISAAFPAEAAKYTVDPVHSSVDFEIGHMGISEITGRFREYSGIIDFDPEAISEMTISATLEISSIDSANEARDEHLQQDDYFHSEKFPYITFVSTKVEKDDDDDDEDEAEYIVTGDLTMHGITQEVKMEFEYGGMTKNNKGKDIIGFELEGEVDRMEFKVGNDHKLDNGNYSLGVEVEFEIHAEAIRVE